MQAVIWAAYGTAFTMLMSCLGAAFVFCIGDRLNAGMQRACMGFAAGVMAAASVFSLLVPAAQQTAAMGGSPALTVCMGFALGAGALMGMDALMMRLYARRGAGDAQARRRTILFTAMTLHNIPEGMAVGLAFALAKGKGGAALAAAAAMAWGIGIQNLPEGAATALAMRQGGMTRAKSFVLSVLSALAEPAAGILVVMAASAMAPALPLLMAVAAGAMMLVVVEEMIPDAAKASSGVFFVMAGYVIMMALDVALQ